LWNAAAFAYIFESLKHYPAQRGVAEKMRELGLAEIRVVSFPRWRHEYQLRAKTCITWRGIRCQRQNRSARCAREFSRKNHRVDRLPACVRRWRQRKKTRRHQRLLRHSPLGHVTYLETARNQGDALLIGVNSDGSPDTQRAGSPGQQ